MPCTSLLCGWREDVHAENSIDAVGESHLMEVIVFPPHTDHASTATTSPLRRSA